MPLYEYKCAGCGDIFEVMQKFSDNPLTQHDKCGGAVERILSAPALQFKGSGWYITDYARGGSSKAAEKKSSDAPKAETKTETKSSDSKPPASSSS
ncbi:MAG TPA: transcriptional regulator [Solibacterales bacterium]|nr:transcriptional regulator [Bryobacterales bacterium]